MFLKSKSCIGFVVANRVSAGGEWEGWGLDGMMNGRWMWHWCVL